MTENYLLNLGFESVQRAEGSSRSASLNPSWRYRHAHAAQDGTCLYAEHPMGIDRCRLSTLPAPLDQHDLLLETDLHNHAALEAAIESFFAAHGGRGPLVAPNTANTFRPYRRQG